MRRLAVVLALSLLLIPTALGTWSSSTLGDAEPSTSWDTPNRMWQNPPPGSQARVYFDLVYNPVSAAPHYEAILGLWVDCNADGIIGSTLGETYPATLLFDVSRCPPSFQPHSRNDGQTVRELLWIGPGAQLPHYDDPDARVWLDVGFPGSPPANAPRSSADDVLSFVPSLPRWVGTAAFLPEPARVTGYAKLGPATLWQGGAILPAPVAYAYGAEACGPSTTGIVNGWRCDPAWWPQAPRVGEVYHLRDVDCTSTC